MKIFVGGATGATGQSFVRIAIELGLEQVVHVRPQSEAKYRTQQPNGPEPALFDLADADALRSAMAGCHGVVSMIGTMKKRFAAGDTYASSDVGTAVSLVEAAKANGVEHIVLMTSLGADWVPGAYSEAKRQAEKVVMESGIPWTITRPSALYGNGRGSSMTGWMTPLRHVPGLRGVVDDVNGIPVDYVARAMAVLLRDGLHKNEAISGRELWRLSEG
ncbi:MAG: NAD(P)H-binding protein [Proteobacteria bacterium]|nr:NAD(P)H-binding protein [Pseudomonadota bacterium]MCP4920960.1 NAD(P)H-binding protein [Pseudomonadota bacterium]